jgi:hypothetical protein
MKVPVLYRHPKPPFMSNNVGRAHISFSNEPPLPLTRSSPPSPGYLHPSTCHPIGYAHHLSGHRPAAPGQLHPAQRRHGPPPPLEALLPTLPASAQSESVPRPSMPVPRPSTPTPDHRRRPPRLASAPRSFFNFVLNLCKIWIKIDYDRVNLDEIWVC